MTETTTRAALRPGLIHRGVGGEVFILMADSTVHWLKNATAVALWQALAAAGPAGVALDALVVELCGAFDVSQRRASEDVRAFLAELADKGVIDVCEPPGDAGGAD